jgi:hypothetical protein
MSSTKAALAGTDVGRLAAQLGLEGLVHQFIEHVFDI